MFLKMAFHIGIMRPLRYTQFFPMGFFEYFFCFLAPSGIFGKMP